MMAPHNLHSSHAGLIVELKLKPQETAKLAIYRLGAIYEQAVAILILRSHFEVFPKLCLDSKIALYDQVLPRVLLELLAAVIVLEPGVRDQRQIAEDFPVIHQSITAIERMLLDVISRRIVLRSAAPVILRLKSERLGIND